MSKLPRTRRMKSPTSRTRSVLHGRRRLMIRSAIWRGFQIRSRCRLSTMPGIVWCRLKTEQQRSVNMCTTLAVTAYARTPTRAAPFGRFVITSTCRAGSVLNNASVRAQRLNARSCGFCGTSAKQYRLSGDSCSLACYDSERDNHRPPLKLIGGPHCSSLCRLR